MKNTKSKILLCSMILTLVFSFGMAVSTAQATDLEEGILECSPNNQTVSVGEEVSFSVTALVGSQDRFYIWDAPNGEPSEAEGQNLNNFETTYSEAGEYTVKVYSLYFGNDTSSCHVTVEQEEEEENDISTVKVCKVDEEENPLSGWTLKLNDGLDGPAENDFSGVTGEDGCVTFDDISYGHREVWEVMQDGWENVSGTGDVTVNDPTETFTVVNRLEDEEPITAKIKAVKIVCPTENLLPNWGNDETNITATTASNFLEENPTCALADWTFEWAPNNTANPGDNTGASGGVWTAFSDDTLTVVPTSTKIWVREVWNSNYIPFSGDTTAPRDNVSAELYCHTDVLNYDNYDWIAPVEAGETYYCIGFNVRVESTPQNSAPTANAGIDQIITLPVNSVNLNGSGSTDSDGTIASYTWEFVSGPSNVDPNDVVSPSAGGLVAGTYVFKLVVTDNDGATDDDTVSITVNPVVVETPQCSDDVDNNDAEDTLADELDPGCHTDGNAGNSGSYNPNDNNETDVPKCSNTGDDDGDQLIDSADPGCHTDGNAGNSGSYDPNDNDESNSEVSNTGGGGGGGGGGGSRSQCSDRKDNSDIEDTLIDAADPGCHSDGNANNPNSYVRSDRSESNSNGQVLGAETSCGIYVEKYLRKGYDNNVEAVRKVQTFLNDYMQAGLVVDGVYGSRTESAVRAFQLRHTDKVLTPWGITASTGIFYITTQTEVNNIMCPPLNIPIPSNLINFYPGAVN